MPRTILTISDDDRRWLQRVARREGVSMAEVLRRAIHRWREQEDRERSFDRLLAATKGIGTGEDGEDVVRRLRDEWDGRSG